MSSQSISLKQSISYSLSIQGKSYTLSIQEKNNVIKRINQFLTDSESGMYYDHKPHCN